jgi:outer membrane protein TolC
MLSWLGAGCAHYQSEPLSAQRSAAQFAARSLDDAELRIELGRMLPGSASQWPPSTWDRAQLLAVALVRNPGLAMMRAQVESARARELTAAQALNPDLTLQSEYARHDAHPWLYGIYLDWPLRSNERRRLEMDFARADTSNAQLALMDQTWAVRSALASALSEWEGARRRLALLERLAAAEDRLVRLEQRRIEAGEDPASELVDEERSRLEIEQRQAEQRIAANASQAAAARALGLPPHALDGIVIAWRDWGEPPPLAEDGLSSKRELALLSRADLGVAIGEYAQAETRLHQAVARQYPQLVLEPGYYWDHGIAKFPFDVGFTVPLNRNQGEITEARAEREVAARRMLALQSDIYGRIAAAERAEQTAREAAGASRRQLEAARRQERHATLAMHVGAADSLELTAATIGAIRVELESLAMQALVQSSRNELEDALHAPLSGPELGLAGPFAASAGAGAAP